jgi:hypothetical protein
MPRKSPYVPRSGDQSIAEIGVAGEEFPASHDAGSYPRCGVRFPAR